MDYLALGFIGLFLAAFLSATIIPLNSEFVLLAMLANNYDPLACLIVATIGNSLGGITNYFLGLLGNPLWFKRFGIKEEKLLHFERRIQKYGFWIALFSWVPFIGDPMTIALGFFRVSFWKVFLLIILGKFLRYLVLILPFV